MPPRIAPETYRMETDLPGLLVLLADHLYSEPDVFVRELLQNSHDAIVSRRRLEPALQGHINLAVDRRVGTITFTDNGIGMDRDDIRRFLSIIGASSKRAAESLTALRSWAGKELIGQFGIGMLSAFVVASSVEVRTRKVGAPGYRWTNNGSVECRLERWDRPETGTDVILAIRTDLDFVLEEDYLRSRAIRYGNFLPFPIHLNGQEPLNTAEPPWETASGALDEAACREFIQTSYGALPLEIIPVAISGPCRAAGLLFITDDRLPDHGVKGTVDLYVQRMFVSGSEAALLPPWAKFIRGVIDSPDLKPTAARDGIKADDPATRYLRGALGELIIERLRTLAEQEPGRFALLAAWHHYHLKGMAFLHDDFFDAIAPSLPFNTNRGALTLGQCLAAGSGESPGALPVLRYHAGSGSVSAFGRIAGARNWLIIDAGLGFDADLLRRYAARRKDEVELVRIDAGDPPGLFQRLAPSEEARYRSLEQGIALALSQAGVERVAVRTRSFAPADIPALVLRDRHSDALEAVRGNLSQSNLLEAAREIGSELLSKEPPRTLTLTINAGNPVIARLADVQRFLRVEETLDGTRVISPLLCALFSSALISSGVPTGRLDADLMRLQLTAVSDGVLNLIELQDEQRAANAQLRQLLSDAGLDSCGGDKRLQSGHFNC